MKQPFCLTYSRKIWQHQVCFFNASKIDQNCYSHKTKRGPLHSLFFPMSKSFRWSMVHMVMSHRWLGCILSVGRFHGTSLDAEFHLQAARRTVVAVRVTDRLRFFDPSWVPDNPSTCFAKHGSCISKASSENDSSSCFCWLDPSLA